MNNKEGGERGLLYSQFREWKGQKRKRYSVKMGSASLYFWAVIQVQYCGDQEG